MSGPQKTTVAVERSILGSAEETAREIKAFLAARGIVALNVISSPGSGKTTLIERIIVEIGGRKRIAVVEGDIETEIDAERIRKAGVAVRQINTRSSCHIQPFQLLEALRAMELDGTDLLFVENVGNLVCPAEIPLGEDVRVVLLSAAEGDEKPLKYPLVFKTSDILVMTKMDLLPYVRFDPRNVVRAARAANPAIEIFETSAVTGAGLLPFVERIASLHDGKAK